MADIGDRDREGLENVIRGFVFRDYDLHARVANLEAWSEVLMTAIGSAGNRTLSLLSELEDARRPCRRPEWPGGRDPRDKAGEP